MKVKWEKLHQGLIRATFTDHNEAECFLQESSLAYPAAIRLGQTDPKIWKRATVGYEQVHIPEGADIDACMHLTQDDVKKLLPILQQFAETGSIRDLPGNKTVSKRS